MWPLLQLESSNQEKRKGERESGLWRQMRRSRSLPRKKRVLLSLRISSITFGLVTGAAEFSELYESTGIKVILHVLIKGEGRRAFQSSEPSLI